MFLYVYSKLCNLLSASLQYAQGHCKVLVRFKILITSVQFATCKFVLDSNLVFAFNKSGYFYHNFSFC